MSSPNTAPAPALEGATGPCKWPSEGSSPEQVPHGAWHLWNPCTAPDCNAPHSACSTEGLGLLENPPLGDAPGHPKQPTQPRLARSPHAPQQRGPGSPCSIARLGERLAQVQPSLALLQSLTEPHESRDRESQPYDLLSDMCWCRLRGNSPNLPTPAQELITSKSGREKARHLPGSPSKALLETTLSRANNCLAQGLRINSMSERANLRTSERSRGTTWQLSRHRPQSSPGNFPRNTQNPLLLLIPRS